MEIAIDAADFAEKFQRALEDFALAMARRLADAAPADTGELRDITRNGFKVTRISATEWAVDFNMPPYAECIEFGTKPHLIRAKGEPEGANYLKFEPGKKARLEKHGRFKESSLVFRKEVHHPGTEPHPFIRPTLHQHLAAELNRALKDHMR